MTEPNHLEPREPSFPLGAEQFMTVDAFDVTVAAGTSDMAIVAKDHSGPLPDHGRSLSEHRAAIEREKGWLRAAAGIAGVVRLVEDPLPEYPHAVVTEFAGSRTLRSHCPDPPATARALACVAETITDLAEKELIHGSVAPEHVILTSDGEAVLCSPNSSGAPHDDLVSLGACIEFATEQWERPPESLTRWLLLAKQLRDRDPTIGPDRAARVLWDLVEPSDNGSRARPVRLVVLGCLTAAALFLVALRQNSATEAQVSGPELEVDGTVVRVGSRGNVAVVLPHTSCNLTRIYLLDPATFQIWTFDRFETGGAATPLVKVPGAVDLEVSRTSDGCSEVLARGPAGEVALP
jgi:hypothetical protein